MVVTECWKRMSEKPYGFLNVDKPAGLTSRDAVNRAVWLLQKRTGLRKIKVGHCGTRDPMATGVLVIGVGSATRLTTRVQQHRKTYRGSFQLGLTTATDDVTGEPIREVTIEAGQFSEASVRELLREFTGRISQVPPAFSAVKVGGKRAYKLARKGRTVEIKPREVDVYSLKMIRFSVGSQADLELEIECGSGTYVRSIGRDIGDRLGCGAAMSSLSRTAIGPFPLESAVPLGELAVGNILEHLEPTALSVCHLPTRPLSKIETRRIFDGRPIERGQITEPGLPAGSTMDQDDIALLTPEGILAAIAIPGQIAGTLKPSVVFFRNPE